MLFEEFEDGCHGGLLAYQNRKILAILNLHVATTPPNKFQLNPIYGSGGDVKKSEKLTRDNGRMMDRRMTDNRPWHKLTWSKAPAELIKALCDNPSLVC